jgi:hypothetical protein
MDHEYATWEVNYVMEICTREEYVDYLHSF